METERDFVIMAAGGNGTAIRVIPDALSRQEYEAEGKRLQQYYASAEQSGFFVASKNHFEMAGGEFCGNATRAAAIVAASFSKSASVNFTVSGYDGVVEAQVQRIKAKEYFVTCWFPKMRSTNQLRETSDGIFVWVVDLGGIVHALVSEPFHNDVDWYRSRHERIRSELHLGDREAVGVIWYRRINGGVKINPVIWVKARDSLIYEEACGSGSIATSIVTGNEEIRQPTGELIRVQASADGIRIASQMRLV